MPLVLDNVQHVARLLANAVPAGTHAQKAIGVALSGGPDSVALAYLLHRQATSYPQGGFKRVHALTIDHGLRHGSAQEAKAVSQWAHSLGISCDVQTIPWGEPPFPDFPHKTGVESSARTARLILFKRFLRRHELQHIYLAHHLDDLVETAYLRQQRGTASALALPGLRSFARLALTPDPGGPADGALALVRPLLDVPKAELLDLCAQHKLPFVIDPTNVDPTYTARNAFRSELQALQRRVASHQSMSGPVQALRQWTRRLTRRGTQLRLHLQRLLREIHTPIDSVYSFNPEKVRQERPEVRKIFLSQLARMASPHADNSSISPSNLAKLDTLIFGHREKALNTIPKFTPGAGVMFTAKWIAGHKCWIVSRQPLRESEHKQLKHELEDDAWHLWDGRFWIRNTSKTACAVSAEGPWVLPFGCNKIDDSRTLRTACSIDTRRVRCADL